MAAKLSLGMQAKKQRIDPQLEPEDDARRALKTKTSQKDGPNWSSKLHQVQAVEQSDLGKKYKISGFKEPFFRHELQKVTSVQYAPGMGPIAERPTLKQVRLRERLTAQRDRVYSMLKASGGMSLLQLRGSNQALMGDLRKHGVKNWAEFLRPHPQYFKVSRGRVAVAPAAAAAAAEARYAEERAGSKNPSKAAPQRGFRLDEQGRLLLV